MKKSYDFIEFVELLRFFYGLGWYMRTLDLFTITMKGGFEAFSGLASETWEHRFYIKNCAIPDIGIESYEADGETIGIACHNLLKKLRGE